MGWMDNFGNFFIDLPEHHVYVDDKGFFYRMRWNERVRTEKEAKIEAFSKLI